MIALFDEAVADMMGNFGSTAYIVVETQGDYDPATSENLVAYRRYPVKALFFDYLDKKVGLGTQGATLIQSGDKQVFVQPPQKIIGGFAMPELQPNKDYFEHNNKRYKIVTLKQYNPSMTQEGCVMYEMYVRG